MANYEKKIYYVTQEQYDILKDGGTVSSYTGIDPNASYFVRPIPLNYELIWDGDLEQLRLLVNAEDSGNPVTIGKSVISELSWDSQLLGGASSESTLTPTENNRIPTSKAVSDFIANLGYVTSSGVTSIATSGTVSGLTLTGGPITDTGTITLGGTLVVAASNFASQTAKTFLAAPNTVNGVPTFRAILASDIPTLNQDTTGNAETATKLATARTFTITDNDATNSQASATDFDGSENFTIKLPPTIKASLTGTASGNLTSSSSLDTTKLSGTIPEASLIDASIPVVGIVQTLIKNISGKDLTNYVVDESHMSETYPYALITYQPTPGAITEAQAKTYMKAILGVTWLPQYDYDWPKNIYIIDGSGILWKPQWINVFGIYELRIYYVTKITTDLTLSSGTTNGTLKLVRNGVTTDNIEVKGLGSAAYTESTNYVPTTRKVNNKALSSDVSLALEDLSNIATEDPATEGQFLVSDGFNWAPTTITLDNIDDGSERKLSDYVTKNTAITGATKTKITYDAKGLVTAGADATLDDLGDVVITTPVTADLLRYNGTNWVNAPASGTYAGPTETLLGNRTTNGTIDLGTDRISNYDEIVVQIEGAIPPDIYKTRYSFPTSEFQYDSGGYEQCTFNFPFSDNTGTVSIKTYEATGQYIGVSMSSWPQDTTVKIFGRNW